MKKSVYILLFILAVGMTACKPREVATKYDNPHWTVTENPDYSVSMTAAIKLPESLNPYLTEDDQMVALVGTEVRGVATPYEGVFYLQVLGTEAEEVEVSFQYWSAKTQFKYQADETFPFEQDAIHGTPDDPLVLTFKVL